MKMETVQAELRNWGEAIITTEGGKTFEVHSGDTQFDFENRVIRLKTSDSHFVIDGDKIEYIQMHFSHPE